MSMPKSVTPMQDLKELVYILKRFQLKLISPQGLQVDKQSMLGQLYEALEQDRIATDEEAEALLYPEKQSGSKYRQLKSVLRERMLHTVASFEPEGQDLSDYQKAYYESHKKWLVIKILSGQNANTAALSLATRLFKQVVYYEFSLLAVDIAAYLRLQYGLRESNDKKFQEYHRLHGLHQAIHDAECRAEEYYTFLMVKQVNSRSAKEEVGRLADTYYQQVGPYLEQFDTYKLHLYGRLIGLQRFTARNRYAEALDYCREALDFFKQKKYEARVPLQIFSYQILICHIQLRQFEEGNAVAAMCMKYSNEGTFNWFKYKELYLQLSFHTHQFDRCAETLKAVTNHPRFQFLPDNAREIWLIYESYAYYLAEHGLIPGLRRDTFKVARFVNATPIYAKDKSGLNIAIMIIKILYLLQQQKMEQVLDESEAIEQYCFRYLRNRQTIRSYYFIRMLLQIPRIKNNDTPEIRRKINKYLLELMETPINIANQIYEIELVPYETLWQLAMTALEGEGVKLKKKGDKK